MLRSNADIAAFDGTGLVREPCPTCYGSKGVPPHCEDEDANCPTWTMSNVPGCEDIGGCCCDPIPCPDCKDGLAPRVVEVDLVNWEGEPPDLGPPLKPRCGTCAGEGVMVDTRVPIAARMQTAARCLPCRGRGYLDPLCDVIAVTVEGAHPCEMNFYDRQCDEVGVALEIKEVSRGT